MGQKRVTRNRLREKPILAFCFVFNKASLSEQNAVEFRRNRCRGKPLETAGRKARGLKRKRHAGPAASISIFPITQVERRTK